MLSHNLSTIPATKQKSADLRFVAHGNASVSFLVCLIVLSCTPSFAQPLGIGRTKFVGNVIHNGNNIRSDFAKYWNQVTPENAGKWGSVENNPGVYNWGELDNIYNYAMTKGFVYKHHCLLWGAQQPLFLSSLDSAHQYQEIDNWIKATGQRYPKADLCDVVNEPLHTPYPYKQALGGNGASGWDWVIKAFQLARQYWSPHTKLILNEYSVINDGNSNTQFLQIINLLKAQNLIDGIGVQAHYFEVDGGASLSTLKTNLDKLTATGLPVYISEYDINQQTDSIQSQRYQQTFSLLFDEPGVEGITLWGYSYGETWKPYTYLVGLNAVERPALQWMRTYLQLPAPSVLISPLGTTGERRNAVLVWHSSVLALSYHLQVSTENGFSTTVTDTTTIDTLARLSPLASNTKFYWRVSGFDDLGEGPYSTTASFTTGDQILAVKQPGGTLVAFAIQQNYPNPFNPSTVISYQLPVAGKVTLKVYDVMGREMATIVDGAIDAGSHSVTFDASHLSSGLYFYEIRAGSFATVKKMLLMK